MSKGKLIVIEGSDGSGKETQTHLLLDRLRILNVNVQVQSFPRYGQPSARPVERYLRGELSNDPSAVNAYAASLFYAMDRYESFLTDWGEFYRSGGIVLCDRYTTSNAVFQASKLPRDQVPSFLNWLYDLEYARLGIPEPDAVVYLHAEPDAVWRTLSARTGKAGVQHDIHEKNKDFLASANANGLYVARHGGWTVVHVTENGAFRERQVIHEEIFQKLSGIILGQSPSVRKE